jgi:deferrochelatase/peroxidase EfeB
MYGDRLDTTRRTRSGRIRDDNKKRGLLFICLNASIADQFELLQHSWLNNRHFAGLYDERDPLLNLGGSTIDNMSIQETPTNLRIDGLQNFVQMRGGGYFFMPGIAALRCLAA